MGRGGARTALAGVVLGLGAWAGIGCGAESHPNEARPQVPTRVSVAITSAGVVTVQPTRIGVGPEPRRQMLQNREVTQPRIQTDRPLDVVFVTANQTEFDSKLELRGPERSRSASIPPNSAGEFQTTLPTGTYTILAAGVPGAKPGKLVVGPVRESSENDVLLP
jgi:hypothetical protein